MGEAAGKTPAISLSNASRRQTKRSQWSSVWSVALIISEVISERQIKCFKESLKQIINGPFSQTPLRWPGQILLCLVSLIQKCSQFTPKLTYLLRKLLPVVRVFTAHRHTLFPQSLSVPQSICYPTKQGHRHLLPSSHLPTVATSPVTASATTPSIASFSSIAASPTEIWRKMQTKALVGFFTKLQMSLTLQKRCRCSYTPPDGRESSGLGSPHWLQEFLRAKFIFPQDLEKMSIPRTELLRTSENLHETPPPD